METKSEIPWADIKAAAEASKMKLQEHIAEMEEKCEQVNNGMALRKIPIVGLCGHGRAGKDLAAEFIRGRFGIDFVGSASQAAAPFIANSLEPAAIAKEFAKRHENRLYWFDFINALRYQDASFLIRMVLGAGNQIVCGVRGAPELYAAQQQGLIDFTVWIDNPRVEEDPTVEYTMDDCDVVIRNNSTKGVFFNRLNALFEMLYWDHAPDREEFNNC